MSDWAKKVGSMDPKETRIMQREKLVKEELDKRFPGKGIEVTFNSEWQVYEVVGAHLAHEVVEWGLKEAPQEDGRFPIHGDFSEYGFLGGRTLIFKATALENKLGITA